MKLFVDTAAWLALHDRSDQYHPEALEKAGEIKRHRIELVTSEYVLDETVTLIRYRVSHQAAVVFGDSMMTSSITRVMDVTETDRRRAWEMFKKFSDKELSFTDCTSFVLMKNMNIRKAFSFDAHFRQMGFEIY